MLPSPRFFVRVLGRPEAYLIGTFGGLILLGTLLLSLPFAHTADPVSPLDAFFTATSAVCVTGLIVVDTGTAFSFAGQTVILLLIQFGGLGIMTFAALIIQVTGAKLSLRSQAALHGVFYQQDAASRYRQNLRWIIALTLGIETLGAILLYFLLPDGFDRGNAAYVAVFHAVSAFCNAGFSTFSDSLIGVRHHAGFMAVISALIILGGLGYTVLFECVRRGWSRLLRRPRPIVWSLNTRVVIVTSFALILLGAALLDLLGMKASESSWTARTGNAVFQAITARTAGFNTVDIGLLPVPSLLWLIFLMFVGGSPGSCAGGVKTTSLAIWLARIKARLLFREDVTFGDRRIPADLVRRTGLLIGVSVLFNLAGIMILAIAEMGRPDVQLEDIIFEQVSAFGTVGLSTGLTPTLTTIGKLWIIVSMFVGRLGPLTMALMVIERQTAAVRLPEERLMVG